MSRRLRILISAYACTPGRGSEPGVGWNAARQAALRHDVWVLTHPEGREAIEKVQAREPAESLPRITYLGSLAVRNALFRGRTLHWLYYSLWQRRALAAARRMHEEIGFDVVHHVTFASWRVPTRLHRLGVPVIFGPVGGGMSVPAGFGRVLGLRGRLSEFVRRGSQALSELDPRLRASLRRCSRVIAANSGTGAFLGALRGESVPVMCEMGLNLDEVPRARPGEPRSPLRVLWVGVLEPRKALPLLLLALATGDLRHRIRLEVVGSGPERGRWERQSVRLGLGDCVEFVGQVTREETLRRFAHAQAFVFTSLRDTTGWVMVEAMAAGLPVIALRLGGAPDLLAEGAGILIEARSVDQVVGDLAGALARLASDPEERARFGLRARERVEAGLTWDEYGRRLESVYEAVAAAGARG